MNEAEKLRVLIPHWMEHNDEHADEYRRWAGESPEARIELLTAVEDLNGVNRALGKALEKLGGAVPHAHPH